jgi:hypothetical protein
MKKTLVILSVFSTLKMYSQNSFSDSTDQFWKLKATYQLNGSQSSFINWNSGGRNNFAVLGNIIANGSYEKGRLKWNNDLQLSLGGLAYAGKTNGRIFQKTDDKIEITSRFGVKIHEFVFCSLLTSFKSQFINGYSYPNDSVRTSAFMAPGYLNISPGGDFTPNEHFTLYASPTSIKLTFVNDETLADSGAFGVQKAIISPDGSIIKHGQKKRFEIGLYTRLTYNKSISKNIDLQSKLELFSNYIVNPQNVDINAEALFLFKINSFFSATFQCALIYDDDIMIRGANNSYGPRTQFKSIIGLGMTYKMMNFKEVN